jgi:hypothetical protein
MLRAGMHEGRGAAEEKMLQSRGTSVRTERAYTSEELYPGWSIVARFEHDGTPYVVVRYIAWEGDTCSTPWPTFTVMDERVWDRLESTR